MTLVLEHVSDTSEPDLARTGDVVNDALASRVKRAKRSNGPVANRLVFTKRVPHMHERASLALGGMFGPTVREVVYCVGNAMQRGHYPVPIAKLILERVLPASRPIQLDLPQVDSGAALIEAEQKITAALNTGFISPAEARTLQEWAKQSWRSRRVAAVSAGGKR